MKTVTFLLFFTLPLCAQNLEENYRDFEVSYNRGLLYSVKIKYSYLWDRVEWMGVKKPLLSGLTAKYEEIKYAAFDGGTGVNRWNPEEHCVIVVAKIFHPRHTLEEHFPEYIVTPVYNDDAAANNRMVYHLKRKK